MNEWCVRFFVSVISMANAKGNVTYKMKILSSVDRLLFGFLNTFRLSFKGNGRSLPFPIFTTVSVKTDV